MCSSSTKLGSNEKKKDFQTLGARDGLNSKRGEDDMRVAKILLRQLLWIPLLILAVPMFIGGLCITASEWVEEQRDRLKDKRVVPRGRT